MKNWSEIIEKHDYMKSLIDIKITYENYQFLEKCAKSACTNIQKELIKMIIFTEIHQEMFDNESLKINDIIDKRKNKYRHRKKYLTI